MTSQNTFCGRVAIVGKPNVGKSTLINRLLEEPISIATHKSHTTRHCILGVKTVHHTQLVIIDTPGIHVKAERTLNRKMNRAAHQALQGANMVLWLTDRLHLEADDERTANCLKDLSIPIIWCMNKIDRLKNSSEIETHLALMQTQYPWIKTFIPISARTGAEVATLESLILSLCPQAPHMFPNDVLTDRSPLFMASETIRAKLFKYTHQEVPYATFVTIDRFKAQTTRVDIQATLWVERPSQKAIVIGKKGENIKRIGIDARKTLCRLLDNTVHLKLWVGVQKDWSDDNHTIDTQNLPGDNT